MVKRTFGGQWAFGLEVSICDGKRRGGVPKWWLRVEEMGLTFFFCVRESGVSGWEGQKMVEAVVVWVEENGFFLLKTKFSIFFWSPPFGNGPIIYFFIDEGRTNLLIS